MLALGEGLFLMSEVPLYAYMACEGWHTLGQLQGLLEIQATPHPYGGPMLLGLALCRTLRRRVSLIVSNPCRPGRARIRMTLEPLLSCMYLAVHLRN